MITCHCRALGGIVPSWASVAEPAKLIVWSATATLALAGVLIVTSGAINPDWINRVLVDTLLKVSVTVRVTVKAPLELKVCVGFGSFDTGVPSPKSHLKDNGSFSGSDVPLELKLTVKGA